MPDLIHPIQRPDELAFASHRLKETARRSHFPTETLLNILERWAAALDCPEVREIPGAAFLRLWLRRSTLEAVLLRELGQTPPRGHWLDRGEAGQQAYPLGVIGHWPAANIEIQPILSITCALLGGNTCLARVPSGLTEPTRLLMQRLYEVDQAGLLRERIFLATFDHSQVDLQEGMARVVDGGMIWGGAEAVSQVRSLPFPPGARVVAFGPRLSAGVLDAGTWANQYERRTWCRRIARDVWQFDQQACSSPQTLFLERHQDGSDPSHFVEELRCAFQEENQLHPRRQIEPAMAFAICKARASWLLGDVDNHAWFPESVDWSILLGEGTDIPTPTQGRTLTVLVADELLEVVSRFDGAVQTLGVAIQDAGRERELADVAARHGVDRVVPLGQMHVFGSPWDGMDLIRPMVRLVHHVRSQNERRPSP